MWQLLARAVVHRTAAGRWLDGRPHLVLAVPARGRTRSCRLARNDRANGIAHTARENTLRRFRRCRVHRPLRRFHRSCRTRGRRRSFLAPRLRVGTGHACNDNRTLPRHTAVTPSQSRPHAVFAERNSAELLLRDEIGRAVDCAQRPTVQVGHPEEPGKPPAASLIRLETVRSLLGKQRPTCGQWDAVGNSKQGPARIPGRASGISPRSRGRSRR